MSDHFEIHVAAGRPLALDDLPTPRFLSWDWLYEIVGEQAADAISDARPATLGAVLTAMQPAWGALPAEARNERLANTLDGEALLRPTTLGPDVSRWLPGLLLRELVARGEAPRGPRDTVDLVEFTLDVTPLVDGVAAPCDDFFASRAWVVAALTEGQKDYFDPGVNPIYTHFEQHYGEGAWAQPEFGGGDGDLDGILLSHRWEGAGRVVAVAHASWVPWAREGQRYRMRTA